MQCTSFLRAGAFLVLTLTFLLAASSASAGTYDPSCTPVATNGSGNLGFSFCVTGSGATASYKIYNDVTGGLVTTVSAPAGVTNFTPEAISGNGQYVTGAAIKVGTETAFTYNANTATYTWATSCTGCGSASVGEAVNSSGQVVGQASAPVLINGQTMYKLAPGSGTGWGISDSGVTGPSVAGKSQRTARSETVGAELPPLEAWTVV